MFIRNELEKGTIISTMQAEDIESGVFKLFLFVMRGKEFRLAISLLRFPSFFQQRTNTG